MVRDHSPAPRIDRDALQLACLAISWWLAFVPSVPQQIVNDVPQILSRVQQGDARAAEEWLIEKARRKRGSDCERVGLEKLDVASATDDGSLLAVDEAIDKLATVDSVGANLIELRRTLSQQWEKHP